MSRQKTSNRAIALAERREQALRLRKNGVTYRAIADLISKKFDLPKYSAACAFRDIGHLLEQSRQQTYLEAELHRQLELERLDMATMAIASQVQQGHLGAVARWICISESRRKLLGLDAPVRLEVDRKLEEEITNFLDKLNAALPSDVFKQVLAIACDLPDGSGEPLTLTTKHHF